MLASSVRSPSSPPWSSQHSEVQPSALPGDAAPPLDSSAPKSPAVSTIAATGHADELADLDRGERCSQPSGGSQFLGECDAGPDCGVGDALAASPGSAAACSAVPKDEVTGPGLESADGLELLIGFDAEPETKSTVAFVPESTVPKKYDFESLISTGFSFLSSASAITVLRKSQ
jgi:hypothetical protein